MPQSKCLKSLFDSSLLCATKNISLLCSGPNEFGLRHLCEWNIVFRLLLWRMLFDLISLTNPCSSFYFEANSSYTVGKGFVDAAHCKAIQRRIVHGSRFRQVKPETGPIDGKLLATSFCSLPRKCFVLIIIQQIYFHYLDNILFIV